MGLAVAESQTSQIAVGSIAAGDIFARSRRAFSLLLEKFDLMADGAEPGTPNPQAQAQEKFLREWIFQSSPVWFISALTAMKASRTAKELRERRQKMAEATLEQARLTQQAAPGLDAPSWVSLCPLCQRGPASRIPGYPEGFSLPEGLGRHLGGRSVSRQCSVMRAVTRELHDVSQRLARQEREFDKAEIERRALVEPSYQIGPDEFVLWDESLRRGAARHAQDMEFAATRLSSLGFLKTQKVPGPVVTWLKAVGNYRIYADPREAGRIECHLYAKKTASRSDRLSAWKYLKRFSIQDRWIRDVPGKLQAILALALKLHRGYGRLRL